MSANEEDDALYEQALSLHSKERAHAIKFNKSMSQSDVKITYSAFEQQARITMSMHFGKQLNRGKVSGVPKEFDFVSSDSSIVGDAKSYTLVKGEKLPPAKFSNIAEHVWLLERVEAKFRFLIFGNDRRVPDMWLSKYGHLVNNIEFYFLDDTGNLYKLK